MSNPTGLWAAHSICARAAACVSIQFGELIEQPPQRTGAEIPGDRLFGHGSRLRKTTGAAMRVRQVRLWECVRRITFDGFFRFDNG